MAYVGPLFATHDPVAMGRYGKVPVDRLCCQSTEGQTRAPRPQHPDGQIDRNDPKLTKISSLTYDLTHDFGPLA